MGRTSSHCKQTLIALLVYVLALTPTLVFAAGKNYNVKTITYDPLEKVISATILDQIAEKTMQKTAKVPVTSYATGSTVAAMIRMGVAGAVIYGLVEGVGWVIENGVVKKPVDDGELHTEYYWKSNSSWSEGSEGCKNPTKFSTGEPAVNEFKSCAVQNKLTDPSCSMNNFEQYKCKAYNERGSVLDWFTIDRFKNQNYDPNQTLVPVSDTELGDKVNNSPQAPQILPDVYNPNNPAGGKAPESTSDALDNAIPTPETEPTGGTKPKPNKDTNGDGIPDTYDPELPSLGDEFTLPEFCSWAVTMCEWYKKYKEDSKQAEAQRESEKVAWQQEEIARQKEESQREKESNFWQKVEDWFKKWDDTPEQNDDTEVEVDQPEHQDIDTTINFGGSCPQPISVPYSFAGASGTIEFSYEPLCQIASFIKPVVITVSAFSAALIIGGIRTEDS
ncbi:virulence factor TspB C-terminal domain-related protein [Acinetobacter guillouiae]|uniref:virulence factor TspB C-terminal domain-related protein n=1 Tax=Acinetobacter guillouiae TaxID=106649 RepID=UPI003AF852D4